MSTLTASDAAAARDRSVSGGNVTFVRLVRSEWIKLTTLRSTWWSLGVAVLISVGISLMFAATTAGDPEFAPPIIFGITFPVSFTVLVAGILGVISVTGEYSTGMIRSSLTAQPRRGAVLLSKAVVIAFLMAVTSIVGYAIAIAVTAPIAADQIDWSDASNSTIRLAFGVLSMVCVALIGVGFGFIIRNGAGAIAITVAVLFVLPIIFNLFTLLGEGGQWLVDLAVYLPSNAANAITLPFDPMINPVAEEDILSTALALIGWAVALLVGGWAVLRSRDA